jgi:hypothetical protein
LYEVSKLHKQPNKQAGTMNPIQEAEFHLSVYHYFLWKSAQEKNRESALQQAAIAGATMPTAQALAPAAATTDSNSNEADTVGGGNEKLQAFTKETTTNNDGNKEGEKTLATPSAVAKPATPTTPNIAASKRYQALVYAMLEQFPQHLAHFPPLNSMMTQACPPIITTLYTDFPAMQADLYVARNRIAHLENLMLNTSFQQNKRKEAPGTATVGAGVRKRARVSPRTSEPTKRLSISNRLDVPDGTLIF